MDIVRGFEIEEPAVVVPWRIGEEGLVELFATWPLRRVTDGYLTTACVSLGGLRHMLGFHFRAGRDGVLHRLELWRQDLDIRRSYRDWQRRLEAEFGAAHVMSPGEMGFDNHEWRVASVVIAHGVFDHFGPIEIVTITDT